MKEQLGTGKPERGSEQPEQKSRGQSDQQEHFAPRLPVLKSQGFDLEFGFLKTEAFLNLEAPNRGEGHLPGLLCCLDGFIGEQVPGLASFAHETLM